MGKDIFFLKMKVKLEYIKPCGKDPDGEKLKIKERKIEL